LNIETVKGKRLKKKNLQSLKEVPPGGSAAKCGFSESGNTGMRGKRLFPPPGVRKQRPKEKDWYGISKGGEDIHRNRKVKRKKNLCKLGWRCGKRKNKKRKTGIWTGGGSTPLWGGKNIVQGGGSRFVVGGGGPCTTQRLGGGGGVFLLG